MAALKLTSMPHDLLLEKPQLCASVYSPVLSVCIGVLIRADDVAAAPPAVLSDADVRAYLRAGVGTGKARKHHDLYERACVNRAVCVTASR